ncbi:MAG: iron-sulfur cluster-binding protein [Dehalococcoidia bacterium]|nr:iron-sulfur cluster-binding protein [Dehalococcoidia bacterium]
MAEIKTRQFKQSAERALRDPQLQAAHARLEHFRTARAAAIAETGQEQWAALQKEARAIKWHTLEHLDHYLGQLATNVERAGGKVFFASTAHEANEYVLDLARRKGVRTVVKSKSMVSEEMGIAELLEKQGIRRVETDLGEYIVQLAHEPPYHIVAPAVHKSKEQVAELFAKELGVPRVADIPGLTAIARQTLRQEFLRADMGMTGANFAVAESGTIAIVTNEGNGRMCSTLPRIHVATMGMERVVPSFRDLGVFLKLLTRSATGQRITSYVSLFSGPRRRDEEDGPEEFHLVILDNGRSRLLGDPELRESLLCIRCGACLNACPVYTTVGGHAYGWVYSGPIGAVVTPVMIGLPKARDLPFASTLCGACKDVCPLKIDLPRMLLTLRREQTQGRVQNRTNTLTEGLLIRAWYLSVRFAWSYRLATRLASWFQRPFVRRGRLRWLPPPLGAWTRARDFPAVASRPFRSRWKKLEKETR